MKKYIYLGVDDADIDLFEGQYDVPAGMCYNSYMLCGEKSAVLDTVDARCSTEWLDKVKAQNLMPDYLVVHHMEPDHAGSINAFLEAYPNTTLVCSKQAVAMLPNFGINCPNVQVVVEGEVLDLGGVTLQFVMAPFIHWPEVMMSYCPEQKVLFSADAFGKFGTYDADPDDWACEARRYYFNICGKYGVQVQNLFKKVTGIEINTICPLHGPVLENEMLAEALRLYQIWCTYGVETRGVLVAYASIHGNTANAAKKMAEILEQKGAGKVAITDLCRDDMAEAIEDAFRMGHLVLCASSYDGNVFPPMHQFIWKLQMKGFQNRRVALVENGSWAPCAARSMKALLEPMKDVTIVEPVVTIRSAFKPTDVPALEILADALLAND